MGVLGYTVVYNYDKTYRKYGNEGEITTLMDVPYKRAVKTASAIIM